MVGYSCEFKKYVWVSLSLLFSLQTAYAVDEDITSTIAAAESGELRSKGSDRVDEPPPPPPENLQSFRITSGYFYRERTDGEVKAASWPSQKMRSNVINTTFDFTSAYLNGILKADLGFIAAWNFEKDYRCSEVAFCSKSNNVVNGQPDIWANDDVDGIALYRAVLEAKYKLGPVDFTLSGGYSQFNAGSLGVNWGFLFPGTYRGAQLVGKIDNLTFTYAWVDKYRTPWATEMGYFLDPSGERIEYIHTGGLKYQFGSVYVEGGMGQSYDWQDRYFGKLGYQKDTLHANYQFYKYQITGVDGAGLKNSYGQQDVISLTYGTPYFFTASAEYVMTRVSSWFTVPEYVPRMTYGYGNSQGRLDYWWNAVSDFNKHEERAFNLGVRQDTYKFADDSYGFFTAANWIYADNIAGWDQSRKQTDNAGYEKGYTVDLGLSAHKGLFENLSFSAHYTHLKTGGKNIDPNDQQSLFKRYGLFTTDDLKLMLIYSAAVKG